MPQVDLCGSWAYTGWNCCNGGDGVGGGEKGREWGRRKVKWQYESWILFWTVMTFKWTLWAPAFNSWTCLHCMHVCMCLYNWVSEVEKGSFFSLPLQLSKRLILFMTNHIITFSGDLKKKFPFLSHSCVCIYSCISTEVFSLFKIRFKVSGSKMCLILMPSLCQSKKELFIRNSKPYLVLQWHQLRLLTYFMCQ